MGRFTKTVTLHLPDSLYDSITDIATHSNRSNSEVMRHILTFGADIELKEVIDIKRKRDEMHASLYGEKPVMIQVGARMYQSGIECVDWQGRGNPNDMITPEMALSLIEGRADHPDIEHAIPLHLQPPPPEPVIQNPVMIQEFVSEEDFLASIPDYDNDDDDVHFSSWT